MRKRSVKIITINNFLSLWDLKLIQVVMLGFKKLYLKLLLLECFTSTGLSDVTQTKKWKKSLES